MRRILTLVCVFLPFVATYPYFRNKIPNGYSVGYPSCQPNGIWNGVGHLVVGGGGARNQFGLDFFNAGKTWTQALCQGDSDGDGMTNGYELGDPNCVWSEAAGNTPERTTNITHPGICNPWNSPTCQTANENFTITCNTSALNCTQFDDNTLNMTIQFPPSPVPAKRTTYACMAFNFPQNQTYHLIGYEPFIDNENVMHHMTLFGCTNTVPANETGVVRECGESMGSCNLILGIWSLGLNGHCVHSQAGFRIGQSGFTQGVIQHHWNNPQLVSNYMDGSGMILFYTSNLRQYDAGLYVFGQNYLEIPPLQTHHTEVGECSAVCTNQYFTGDVQIFAAFNHMHYLGHDMKLELHRDGNDIAIAEDQLFFYDSPKLHEYEDPITMKPGDTITTTCGYQSLSRNETTLYGEGTHEEMCYGLVYYYPTSNMSQNAFTCIQWKGLSECERRSGVVSGCTINDFHAYWNADKEARRVDILDSCGIFEDCTAECFNATYRYRDDPCLYGDVYDLIREDSVDEYERLEFHISLETCGLCFRYYNLSDPENTFKSSYDFVIDKCTPVGKCLPKCQNAFDIIQNHPCMRKYVYPHFRQLALDERNTEWLKFHDAKKICGNN